LEQSDQIQYLANKNKDFSIDSYISFDDTKEGVCQLRYSFLFLMQKSCVTLSKPKPNNPKTKKKNPAMYFKSKLCQNFIKIFLPCEERCCSFS